jgi:hypothetical protein
MTTSKISELQDSIDLTTIEILVPTMNKKNAIKYTIFDFRKIDIDKISNFVNSAFILFPSVPNYISIKTLKQYMDSQSMLYSSILESTIIDQK